ncbi:MAG: DUF4258 domain-containing protein [Armatimonadetes bacterium]|nr:DUF4258 domain-containing protein [Armatimonadota bacterium]
MDIRRIQRMVANGKYTLGKHALNHACEDGFEKEHCIGAILGGRVLEHYPKEGRFLLVGQFHLSSRTLCPLHVVCDLTDWSEVTIVTAYIPRPPEWETPWQRARCAGLGRR